MEECWRMVCAFSEDFLSTVIRRVIFAAPGNAGSLSVHVKIDLPDTVANRLECGFFRAERKNYLFAIERCLSNQIPLLDEKELWHSI